MDQKVIKREEEQNLATVNALGDMLSGLVKPLAESQTAVAQQQTKQIEIVSAERIKMFWGSCALAFCVLTIAGLALFLGKDQLAEKVLIAVVSFLGGMGIGRQVGKKG